MPFDPAVTFEKAEQARRDKLSIGKQRKAPEMLGILDELNSKNHIHIFNVGPWPHIIACGSVGYFHVPPCEKGKEYSECTRTIKPIESELVIKDEFEYHRLMDDGWKFACEVVGDGRGRSPSESYRRYGLFPSKNASPTKEEISTAKLELHATCSEIVREARDLYAMDRKAFSVIVKRERHFMAAEVLNLRNETWMTDQTPSQHIQCQFCGTMNDEIAVKCSKCNEIINAARYRELKDEQEAILTEPKKKEGK
jgi:hypothetical protein